MDNAKQKYTPLLLCLGMTGIICNLPMSAFASPKFDAAVSIAIEHSSNITLTPDNDNEATSFKLSPMLSFQESKRPTNYALIYRLDSLQYKEDQLDSQNRHNLLASVSNTAVNQQLKTTGSYNISQIRQSTRTSPSPNAVIQPKTTEEVHTQSFQTNFNGNQNRYFDFDFALNANKSESGDSQFESETYGLKGNLSNGSRLKKHRWNTVIEKQYFDGDRQTQSVKNRFSGNTDIHVQNDWYLRLQGEYQKYDVDTTPGNNITTGSYGAGATWRPSQRSFISLTYNFDSENDDEFFAGDFRWQPSKRTFFTGSANKEVFGKSYQFSANHNTRLLVNKVNYSESLSDFSGSVNVPFLLICPQDVDTNTSFEDSGCRIATDLTDLPDASKGEFALQSVQTNLFDGQQVNKTFSASSAYRKGKSAITLGVNHTRRYSFPKTGDLIREVGVNATWQLKIDSRNTLNFNTQFYEVDDSSDASNIIEYFEQRFNTTYKRILSKHINVSISGGYNTRDTERLDTVNEYTLLTTLTLNL